MRHSLFLTAAYMILRVEALRVYTMPVMMTLDVEDVDTIDYVYEQVEHHWNISNLRLSALNLNNRLCTLLKRDMCGRPWTLYDYQIQHGATILATRGTLQFWSPQPPFNDSDTQDRDRSPPPTTIPLTIPMTDDFDLPSYPRLNIPMTDDILGVSLHLLRLVRNLATSGRIPPCWGDSEYDALARATISSPEFRRYIMDTSRHDFNFNGGSGQRQQPHQREQHAYGGSGQRQQPHQREQHAYRPQQPRPKRTAYDGWVNYRTHCPPNPKIPVPTPRPTTPPTSPRVEFS